MHGVTSSKLVSRCLISLVKLTQSRKRIDKIDMLWFSKVIQVAYPSHYLQRFFKAVVNDLVSYYIYILNARGHIRFSFYRPWYCHKYKTMTMKQQKIMDDRFVQTGVCVFVSDFYVHMRTSFNWWRVFINFSPVILIKEGCADDPSGKSIKCMQTPGCRKARWLSLFELRITIRIFSAYQTIHFF